MSGLLKKQYENYILVLELQAATANLKKESNTPATVTLSII